jgi:hypothetical protein
MKKCPACMREDPDAPRFCKNCGTEMFFPERFGEKNRQKKIAEAAEANEAKDKGCAHRIKKIWRRILP